jgi:hypothetical protein
MRMQFLGRERCGRRRTGWDRWAGDGRDGADAGGGAGMGDVDAIFEEGAVKKRYVVLTRTEGGQGRADRVAESYSTNAMSIGMR